MAPCRVETTTLPSASTVAATAESWGLPSDRVVASTARWLVRMNSRVSVWSMPSRLASKDRRPPGYAPPMLSTMQDGPLLVSGILRHGQRTYGDSLVITAQADGYRDATFTQVATGAEKLAAALARLGVAADDRVGTFAWND